MSPLPLPNELLLLAESQWLFTENDLKHTPSVIAGLKPTKERENRAKGVNFILQAGIMLKLPQITLATASVYLHRFFMRYPMIEDPVTHRPHQHYYSIAATCLFLATKVEENCRKMKDLVIACVRVAQKSPSKEVDEQDTEFWRWRDTILQLEDLLLEALCFDLSLESPYKTLYSLLLHFHVEDNQSLRNAAWAFVNDSCLTPLCLLYPSRTIAASAIYAAARHTGARLLDDEKGRPWWEVAGIDLHSMRKVCNYMASLYENVPRNRSSNGTEDGGGSMYQHTPEDGEDRFCKTRETRPGVSTSPRDSTGPLSENKPPLTARTPGDERSPAASDTSRKRGREENEDEEEGEIPWGGENSEGRKHEDKRRRIVEPAVNGTNGQTLANGDKPERGNEKEAQPRWGGEGSSPNNAAGDASATANNADVPKPEEANGVDDGDGGGSEEGEL